MSDSARSSSDRKVSLATTKKQLVELRTRGLNNPTVADLTELLWLAAELVPDAALEIGVDEGARYWEGNDDLRVRRIEVLLECALDPDPKAEGWLSDPLHAQAARLWFGLDPKTRKLGQGERHEEARLALGRPIQPGTWRNSYVAKIKDGLAMRLRRRVKAKEPFTLDQAVRPAPARAAPLVEGADDLIPASAQADALSSSQRRLNYLHNPLLGVAAAFLILGAAVFALASSGAFDANDGNNSPPPLIPPRGTIINATTGKVDPHPNRRPPTGDIHLIGGGPIFRACNFTRDPGCNFREGQFRVALGDRVRFVFVLENEGRTPLPYARFSVNFQNGVGVPPNGVRAAFFISWPGNHNEAKHLTTEKGDVIFFSRGEPIYIRYIPGSTELLPLNPQHRLTYLPDGVASLYGIGLTHIGPPPGCFINCTGRFIRFLEFEGEVVR